MEKEQFWFLGGSEERVKIKEEEEGRVSAQSDLSAGNAKNVGVENSIYYAYCC